MIRSTEITDTYADGRYLRRWSIVEGHALCVEDAYDTTAAEQAVLDAQIAANAEVRTTIAAIEVYEEAWRIAGQDEPAPTIDTEEGMVENPAWAEWNAAMQAVSAADQAIVDLAAVRRGEVVEEPVV